MKSIWQAVAALVLISSMALAQDAPAHCRREFRFRQDRFRQADCDPDSHGGPEYVIGPEDSLHVAVWKEADLTATLPVRPDGKISLPLA